MDTYKITSHPWQLKAAAEGALKAIILPLVPEIELMPKSVRTYEDYWTWKSSSVNLIALMWGKDELPGAFLIDRLPYQKSDRIYLAEEWVKAPWGNDNGKITGYIYFTNSHVPEAEHMGWQPAEEMPEEAAQYWFEVGDVRVVQMSDIDRHLCDRAALTDIPSDLPCGVEEWASIFERWNAAHPDYLWDADRWVIVLDLKELDNANA